MAKYNYFPQSPGIFHSIEATKFQSQVQPVFCYISIIKKKKKKIDLNVDLEKFFQLQMLWNALTIKLDNKVQGNSCG